MTVAVQTPTITYSGNGTSTVFAAPFRYRLPTDVKVIVRDADGGETTLIYGTDYTAAPGNTNAGGDVTLAVAPAAGTAVVIFRQTAREQTADYITSGAFTAESHEDALDQAMLVSQEQDRLLARSILVPEGIDAPRARSFADALPGDLLQVTGDNEIGPLPFAQSRIGEAELAAIAAAEEAAAARDALIAAAGAPEFANYSAGARASAAGSSFLVFKQGQLLRYLAGVSAGALDPVFAFPSAPVFATPPLLLPGSAWTGTAGSGFVSAPADPTRTTAKPAVRLLTPPRQRFTDELTVGVAAFANNGGSLIGGIARVRFHFEGRIVDVTAPTYRRFADANGNLVSYLGYWVTLKKPSGKTGEAQLYVEAFPGDATMQRRVLGPYSFFPQATLYDLELTVNPDAAVTGNNYATFDAAIVRVKASAPANPRITFKKAMTNVGMNFAGVNYTPAGYITVEADFPVSFGYSSLGTTASVDSVNSLRPNAGPIWLKGANITIDYAYVDAISAETGHDWVLDGVTMTNSFGPGAFWRGGVHNNGQRVTRNPYFLECTISNVLNACVSASLARGCNLQNVSDDIFSEARCVVGTLVQRQNDNFANDDAAALSVVYTGTQATATVARSGGPDPTSCTYTFKWGANSRTFTAGKAPAIYAAGLTGDQGYTFAHLVTWINTVLAGLDAGWSATGGVATSRRASSGSLAGAKGQGFADTSCKTAALAIVSNFDRHGDWYQQYFGGLQENAIAYDNVGFDMQTQNLFISSDSPARDMVFFNNALSNEASGVGFDDTVVVSQLGRQSFANALSHIVVAHHSMPNQGLTFRNDGTSFSTTDAYCLVANNALRSLAKSVTTAGREPGATIRDNHIHTGQTPLAEAVGTTIGGDKNSLFASFNTGDFSPAGALLANLKAPRVTFDRSADRRAPTAPVGCLA